MVGSVACLLVVLFSGVGVLGQLPRPIFSFIRHPENVSVVVGESAVFSCQMSYPLDCLYGTIHAYWIVSRPGNSTKYYLSDCSFVYPDKDPDKYLVSFDGMLLMLTIRYVSLEESMSEFFCLVLFPRGYEVSGHRHVSRHAVLTVSDTVTTTSRTPTCLKFSHKNVKISHLQPHRRVKKPTIFYQARTKANRRAQYDYNGWSSLSCRHALASIR